MSKINKVKIGDVSYDIQDLSIGDLNNLSTEDKTSVVNAINEVLNNVSGKADISYVDENLTKMVSTTGSQTIEGQKTFAVLPVVTQDPAQPEQLASKAYVDVTVLNAIGTALGGEY